MSNILNLKSIYYSANIINLNRYKEQNKDFEALF